MEEKGTSCHSCPFSAVCSARPSGGEDVQEASGCKLVSQAIVFFLLPIAAAIVVAAMVKGENVRILAGIGTFIIVSAAVAMIGWYLRRKRKVNER